MNGMAPIIYLALGISLLVLGLTLRTYKEA